MNQKKKQKKKKKTSQNLSEDFKEKKRLQKISHLLNHYYPNPQCALNFENPLQLLIATILSAQCTDKRVNQVTFHLFQKYSSAQAFAEAPLKDLERAIHSTGFFKNKAKNIKASCQKILSQHKGIVPSSMEELIQLPGVGRKTANVVLGNAFSICSGVVVDTHVRRLSRRLGWTENQNPEKIERDLMKKVPKKKWIQFSHWLIQHGRNVCKSRKPSCSVCFLEAECPKNIEPALK